MDVFVYGTLTDPDRVAEVLAGASVRSAESAESTGSEGSVGRSGVDGIEDGELTWSFPGDATLRGLHRVDGRYPTLAPGGHVDGRILRTDAVEVLDAYEGVDSGLYVRVPVPVATSPTDAGGVDGDPAVSVYVGDPERLDPVDAVTWPGAGDLGKRVRRYVDANDVVVERS